MKFKIQSFLLIFSFMASTLGLDSWRMFAFYGFSSHKIEFSQLADLSVQSVENDDAYPIDAEQTPFSQYGDIIEKEPQCFNEQISLLRFSLDSSILAFFLQFSWKNISMESMYTPPEV